MERKTTSIKINPEIWKQVKIHCATQEIGICDYLEGLLEKNIKEKIKINTTEELEDGNNARPSS